MKKAHRLISLLSALGLISLSSASVMATSLQRPDFIYLQQNWTPQDREKFYWTSQGSALISYDIYLALFDELSQDLFNSPKGANAYGLLMGEPNRRANPDRLPIGVTLTGIADGPYAGNYMGLTCAACHTSELRRNGKTIIIDGGKSNTFDIVLWMRGLSASLDATLASSEKFDALIKRMRARGSVDVADVKRRLKADAENVKRYNDQSFIVSHSPGPGRMDAIGVIQNFFLGMAPQIPANQRVAASAAKVPFLWNTGQSSWVEWSGVAPNPFARNFGEAMTTFTRLDTSKLKADKELYYSTVDAQALIALEGLSVKLAPPKWPEKLFGQLNPERIKRGEQLFEKNCSECHNRYPYRWTDPRQNNKRMLANALVPISVMGVDPEHLNAGTFSAEEWVVTQHLAPLFNGKEKVSASEFFEVMQTRFVNQALDGAKLSPEARLKATGYLGDDPESKKSAPVMSFKAPPIEGVWAVAPYLHNGSVPNLYELLSPASERSRLFYVGSEFDPVKVGFDTTGRSGGRLHDVRVKGDGNGGHSFENGTGRGIIGPYLTPEQRYDLIAFLKSLPDQANRATPYGGTPNSKLAKDDPNFFNTKKPY
jgi:hypothetical protein